MGNIFSGSRNDKAGFTPLTAQEDRYTDDDEEDELEMRRILNKK